MNTIQEYDLVALTENIPATHKTTHQPILLRRGQMGTVLMSFDRQAFLIDFTDRNGQTFAMETVDRSQPIGPSYFLEMSCQISIYATRSNRLSNE